MKYMPLICYLSRLYIYPKYRNNGIATYIYENLQELFEYATNDLTSIFITLPCPQEPTLECQTDIDHFFQAIASKNDEFIRKRNLSIVSLVIDTGLSVQDIIELNIYNVSDDKIVYQDSGGNITQYILGKQTIIYLKQHMDTINKESVNQPLFTSAQKGRISSEVIQNLLNDIVVV